MIKIKKIAIIAASILIMGCFSNDDNKNNNPTPVPNNNTVTKIQAERYKAADLEAQGVDNTIATANNKFAFKVFKEIMKEAKEQKNTFLSPYSLSTALAMTYNGAQKDTKEAMAKTLEYYGMDDTLMNSEQLKLKKALQGADDQVQLDIANSIWQRIGYAPSDYFQEMNKKYYEAYYQVMDFSKPDAADIINGWVEKNTGDKIKNLVDSSIVSGAEMLLINTIYFKGDWKEKFDERLTYQGTFTTDEGKEESVPMMSMKNKELMFYDDEISDFKVLRLPYGRDKISMYLFSPKKGNVDEMINSFDEKSIDGAIAKMYKAEPMVSIPKFKFEYEIGLNDILTKLGMKVAFSAGKADFGKIANSLFISLVKQKSFIEVNEKGTEAAAATVVVLDKAAMPLYFSADKPFFFLIRDDRTGLVLFMGKVVNPTIK